MDRIDDDDDDDDDDGDDNDDDGNNNNIIILKNFTSYEVRILISQLFFYEPGIINNKEVKNM
jgi:hypothetical protein